MEAEAQVQPEPVCTERNACRACESKTLVSVLDLGLHYLPRFVEAIDETLPKAPLHLVQCAMCGLLQLHHTVDPDLLYRKFWYRSSVNQTMRDALSDLVQAATEFYEPGRNAGKPRRYVWADIGANDGTLLSCVDRRFQRIAIEPAVNLQPQLEEHSDLVVPTYFSAKALRERTEQTLDVITSAAMFYDLDDPNAFVRDIAGTLSNYGVWVNQLNDAPTMLARNAVDAVCHEHLCYWSVPALDRLYRQHGLCINQVTYNEVNGGSVRVFASRIGRRAPLLMSGFRSASPSAARAFAERVERWKRQLREMLASAPLAYASIWGYGASTKGSTLLQYLDSHESFLAIADRNPAKHGLRMAGTWLPISDEATMRKAQPKFLFVLPWSFRTEFLEREAPLRESGTTMIFPLPNLEYVL